MTIDVGEPIPEVTLKTFTADGVRDVSTADLFRGKKVTGIRAPAPCWRRCSPKFWALGAPAGGVEHHRRTHGSVASVHSGRWERRRPAGSGPRNVGARGKLWFTTR
ncbi:MAG: hypothetical protein GY929_00920 [Actinomycetia bacterium]|nr:hypothetical protein [Actinomycetes bacterium]